jgi:hypothetical protein
MRRPDRSHVMLALGSSIVTVLVVGTIAGAAIPDTDGVMIAETGEPVRCASSTP